MKSSLRNDREPYYLVDEIRLLIKQNKIVISGIKKGEQTRSQYFD